MIPLAFEATILLEPGTDAGMEDLDGTVARIAADLGLPCGAIPEIEPGCRLFDLGPVQVLIATTDRAMPMMHFKGAQRPARALLGEDAILARLNGHEHNITVLVSDTLDGDCRGRPACERMKLRLCHGITEALRRDHRECLVFWGDTDTLYSHEEFEMARIVPAGPGPEAGVVVPFAPPSRSEVQRGIEARALRYIRARIREGAHRAPPPAATHLSPGRLQLMRSVAVGCASSTVGLSAMQVMAGTLPGF